MNRARAIERSIWCCVLGALSLLPVIGLPAALIAFWLFHSVRRTMAESWNPAGKPLVIGFVLAWAGLVVSLVAVTFSVFFVWVEISARPTW